MGIRAVRVGFALAGSIALIGFGIVGILHTTTDGSTAPSWLWWAAATLTLVVIMLATRTAARLAVAAGLVILAINPLSERVLHQWSGGGTAITPVDGDALAAGGLLLAGALLAMSATASAVQPAHREHAELAQKLRAAALLAAAALLVWLGISGIRTTRTALTGCDTAQIDACLAMANPRTIYVMAALWAMAAALATVAVFLAPRGTPRGTAIAALAVAVVSNPAAEYALALVVPDGAAAATTGRLMSAGLILAGILLAMSATATHVQRESRAMTASSYGYRLVGSAVR